VLAFGESVVEFFAEFGVVLDVFDDDGFAVFAEVVGGECECECDAVGEVGAWFCSVADTA
jgi:hypothetical protein